MNDYELLYVLSGGLSEAEATKASDEVGNALVKLGGKVAESSGSSDESRAGFQGRKRLAYPIGKQDHGWYVVIRFSLEPAKVNDLQKSLNLNNDVVRTVLIKTSELPTAEEAERIRESAEKSESERETKKPAPKREETTEVPETVKKSAPKAESVAEKPVEKVEPKPEPKAKDEAERKQELDEKLGEILKD